MILAALLSAVAAAAAVYLARRFMMPGGIVESQQNIKKRIAGTVLTDITSRPSTLKKQIDLTSFDILRPMLMKYPLASRIGESIEILKWKISVSVFILISLSILLITLSVLRALIPVPLAGMAALLLGAGPLGFLAFSMKRYQSLFTDALPDTLSIFSNAVKSGYGIESAILLVSNTAPFPVNEQFKKMQGEMSLGASLVSSLANLHARMPSDDLKILITGITINQEVGGNLSEILSNLEKTMRDRQALKREIAALSSQGRATAVLLSLVPVAVIALQCGTPSSREQFILFARSIPGSMALALCVVVIMAAVFWIFKMIQLKD